MKVLLPVNRLCCAVLFSSVKEVIGIAMGMDWMEVDWRRWFQGLSAAIHIHSYVTTHMHLLVVHLDSSLSRLIHVRRLCLGIRFGMANAYNYFIYFMLFTDGRGKLFSLFASCRPK